MGSWKNETILRGALSQTSLPGTERVFPRNILQSQRSNNGATYVLAWRKHPHIKQRILLAEVKKLCVGDHKLNWAWWRGTVLFVLACRGGLCRPLFITSTCTQTPANCLRTDCLGPSRRQSTRSKFQTEFSCPHFQTVLRRKRIRRRLFSQL